MQHLDGSEKTLFGFNLGVVGFGLVATLLSVVLFLECRKLRSCALDLEYRAQKY